MFVQATLPKRVGVQGGTFKPYMKGVYFAYAFVCYCYFTVAITGYWAFGQGVSDNVLLSIQHPKWVVGVADMFVVIHVFGSYQVCMLLLPAANSVLQLAAAISVLQFSTCSARVLPHTPA